MDKTQKIKLHEDMTLIRIHENYKKSIEIEKLKVNKQEIQDRLCGTVPYNQWIILYDLLNKSYYEIKNDLNNMKIVEAEIINIIDKANEIHNIFNKKDILAYIAAA